MHNYSSVISVLKVYSIFIPNSVMCHRRTNGTNFSDVLSWIQFWKNSYFSFPLSFSSFNFRSYSIFVLEI